MTGEPTTAAGRALLRARYLTPSSTDPRFVAHVLAIEAEARAAALADAEGVTEAARRLLDCEETEFGPGDRCDHVSALRAAIKELENR